MELRIYKGFDITFLTSINEVPLVSTEIVDKLDVLKFDIAYKKKLDASLTLMDNDDVRWVTYEEYSLINDKVALAINDYGLKVNCLINNLFPDCYLIPFDIDYDTYYEIKKAEEDGIKESLGEISIVSSFVFQTYSDYWYKDLLRISKNWISYKRTNFHTNEVTDEWSYQTNNDYYSKKWDYVSKQVFRELRENKESDYISDCGEINLRITFNSGEHWDKKMSSSLSYNGLDRIAYEIKTLIPNEESTYPDLLDNIPLFFTEYDMTRENLKDLQKDDICALMYAEGGAMGSPGEVCIIDVNGNKYVDEGIYKSNSKCDISQIEVIDTFFEGFKHVDGFAANKINVCRINDENWIYLYLGAGNHLYLRHDFWHEHGMRIMTTEEQTRYGRWKKLIKDTPEDRWKKEKSIIDIYNNSIMTFIGDKRSLNKYVMDNTIEMCNSDKELIEAINYSKEHQFIVYQNDVVDVKEDKPTTNIIVSRKRTFEAASFYKGKKVAVLNFANNHSVGGSPWSAGAQEESLCRCSTLYPCILDKEKDFYKLHSKLFDERKLDYYGNDDLIYTPKVVVFKSDESAPLLLENNERYHVDVITCAAPSLYFLYDKDKYEKIMRTRIKRILEVAKKEETEVLILGAFGCGAFRNPPEVVARLFKEELEHYHFEKVEFAVYCREESPNDNYNIFNKTLE